ncbi:tubby-like F-box protein 2 [Medicago truncatula]|uniref:tubby-like F-box protein 2 n=1 Tax=Medicago truncatula TaxID=3880 RepID=UPI000D2F1F56|nr:tubby-like F-box protein 2 [Medicago truncatula]
MSLKSIVQEPKGIKNGISKQGPESEHLLHRIVSHLAMDSLPIKPLPKGEWETLPRELLLDIIRKVEESETSWPARAVVVVCASVCKSWRSVTKEIVKTLQQCGRITFPISLMQPGPRYHPIHCFIRRNRRTSTFLLYLVQSENKSTKLLLAAKRIRRSNFVISLAADDFSRASNKYVGKLRSNFWRTKFTIYDSQSPLFDETLSSSPALKGKRPTKDSYFASLSKLPELSRGSFETFILKNKALRWDEKHNGWCPDFMGRVKVESMKNFDLVAVVDRSHNVSPGVRKWPILQLGSADGKDIFFMHYTYPFSAFQAFAICLICCI